MFSWEIFSYHCCSLFRVQKDHQDQQVDQDFKDHVVSKEIEVKMVPQDQW